MNEYMLYDKVASISETALWHAYIGHIFGPLNFCICRFFAGQRGKLTNFPQTFQLYPRGGEGVGKGMGELGGVE